MKTTSTLNQDGIAHIALLVAIPVVLVVGLVGWRVVAIHNSNASKSALSITGSNGTSAAAKASAADSKTLDPADTAGTAATTSGSTSTKSSTTPPSPIPVPPPVPRTPTPVPAVPPTPVPATATPLSALTTVISDLKAGKQARVTADSVAIPGPITTAHGRPLVFTLNGQVYFAYTQGTKPNFSTSASQTAGTMAIVKATVSGAATLSAYLDKSGNLVDEYITAVGYSTGGN